MELGSTIYSIYPHASRPAPEFESSWRPSVTVRLLNDPKLRYDLESGYMAQIIPLSEHHLQKAVKENPEHCHYERNHQGSDNQLIVKAIDELNMVGAVDSRERLGGNFTYYHRRAA